VELITHHVDGEERGAAIVFAVIVFVICGVCVVIGKAKVRCDVTCGVGSKTE